MKNQYKFFSALALGASSLFAQQVIPCYTDEATKHYFDTHPAEKTRYEREKNLPVFTEAYKNQLAARSGNNAVTGGSPYVLDTIPVVFHILHQNGPEDVPDSYVYQALAEVNRVHTKTIPDTAQIDPLFQGVSGANNYVFHLATKDPNGNCTNGIVRHLDPNTNWDQTQYSNYAYTWDPTKYLNVYIVKNICSGQPCPNTSSGGIIVGYTYLPGTWGTGAAEDAVVYNYQFMTGTDGRSMAHEFGHWLDLSHTFGNTNTPGTCLSNGQSDDFLSTKAPAVACTGVTDDTPKYAGAFSTCPPSTPNNCDTSNTANVQNIMDYASCPKNFTNGQIKRMHNMMGSTTVGRNNVMTAANKIATGIRYPSICVPIANFASTNRSICVNSIVTFSDSSFNAHPTQWNWSFPNGTLQGGTTLTDSMPKVSYATPGVYAVSYTATTSAGSNSITKTSFINVLSNVATYNTPYVEGFETSTLPGPDWNVYHSITEDWAVTSTASASGSKSAMIDNINNTAGNNSILESNSFDLAGFSAPTFTFKMAYQQQATTNSDKLQVFSSTDCGNTWVSRWARTGTALATVTPPSTVAFVPGPSQFTTYTVNINAVATSTNVHFRFEFFADPNGQGNDIYLDDINIYDAAAGINQFEAQLGLEIYPNPSSGAVSIDFKLSQKQNVAVSVTDLLGRTIESIPAKQYATGETKLTVADKVSYQPGVYLINLNVDGRIISKKIIMQ